MYEGSFAQLTYSLRGTPPFGEYNIDRDRIEQDWYNADLQRAAGILEAALDNVKSKGVARLSEEKKDVCFLSFRFTEEAKKYGAEVKQFLELQELEVLTGERFQPTSLKRKIEPMLNESEFGVAVLGKDEQTAWTRDEVRLLADNDKTVIFLVEEGVTFEQALFGGDLEFIPFPPGHISEGFIKLLEGIKFVQSGRKREANSD